MLSAAHWIISQSDYKSLELFEEILGRYIDEDYLIDTNYRRFYYAFDKIEDAGDFENLRVLVENIYTNRYLARLLPAWMS